MFYGCAGWNRKSMFWLKIIHLKRPILFPYYLILHCVHHRGVGGLGGGLMFTDTSSSYDGEQHNGWMDHRAHTLLRERKLSTSEQQHKMTVIITLFHCFPKPSSPQLLPLSSNVRVCCVKWHCPVVLWRSTAFCMDLKKEKKKKTFHAVWARCCCCCCCSRCVEAAGRQIYPGKIHNCETNAVRRRSED